MKLSDKDEQSLWEHMQLSVPCLLGCPKIDGEVRHAEKCAAFLRDSISLSALGAARYCVKNAIERLRTGASP